MREFSSKVDRGHETESYNKKLCYPPDPACTSPPAIELDGEEGQETGGQEAREGEAVMTGYAPVGHCPAESCADGKRKPDYVDPVQGDDIPDEVTQQEGEALYRCLYCGLMWTQKGSDQPGILRRGEARAVGIQKLGEQFRAIPADAPFKFDASVEP